MINRSKMIKALELHSEEERHEEFTKQSSAD